MDNQFALRPDAQAFDEVRIRTVPRFKMSGLSGDEWRISGEITLFWKGKPITAVAYRDVETAAKFLPTVISQAINTGLAYFAGEPGTCDQEGCSHSFTVVYRLKSHACDQCAARKPARPDDSNLYRKFCAAHARRGDSDLEDNDNNYEVVAGDDPDWRARAKAR